jgi:hypothetical protein
MYFKPTVNQYFETAGNWYDINNNAMGRAPTSADNVFFNGNSGSGTIISGGGVSVYCANLDSTGFTGSFAFGNSGVLNCYGNLIIGSGVNSWYCYFVMLFGNADNRVQYLTDNRTNKSTSSPLNGGFRIRRASSTAYYIIDKNTFLYLGGQSTVSGYWYIASGVTVHALGLPTPTTVYIASNATLRSANPTSTNVKITSQDITSLWEVYFIVGGSSTFSVNSASTFGTLRIKNGYKFTGQEVGAFNQILPSVASIQRLEIDSSLGYNATLQITSGQTITLNGGLALKGISAGSKSTIRATTPNSIATLSVPTGKTVDCNFMDITDIVAANSGNVFYAGLNSTVDAESTGWTLANYVAPSLGNSILFGGGF